MHITRVTVPVAFISILAKGALSGAETSDNGPIAEILAVSIGIVSKGPFAETPDGVGLSVALKGIAMVNVIIGER